MFLEVSVVEKFLFGGLVSVVVEGCALFGIGRYTTHTYIGEA